MSMYTDNSRDDSWSRAVDAAKAAQNAAKVAKSAAKGASAGTAAGPVGWVAGATVGVIWEAKNGIGKLVVSAALVLFLILLAIISIIMSVLSAIPNALFGDQASDSQVNEIKSEYWADVDTKNSSDLVMYCRQAANENWGYVTGTYGNPLTKEVLQQKLEQYPEKVEAFKLQAKKWIGNRTCDCLGLIKGYMWYDTSKEKYVVYSNNFDDYAIDAILNASPDYGTIDTIPEIPGLAVWMSNHIGVYVGNGKVIHSNGYYRGVEETPIEQDAWEYWMVIPELSYDIDPIEYLPELEESTGEIDSVRDISFPELDLERLFLSDDYLSFLTDYLTAAEDGINTILQLAYDENIEYINNWKAANVTGIHDEFHFTHANISDTLGFSRLLLICDYSTLANEKNKDSDSYTVNIENLMKKLYRKRNELFSPSYSMRKEYFLTQQLVTKRVDNGEGEAIQKDEWETVRVYYNVTTCTIDFVGLEYIEENILVLTDEQKQQAAQMETAFRLLLSGTVGESPETENPEDTEDPENT